MSRDLVENNRNSGSEFNDSRNAESNTELSPYTESRKSVDQDKEEDKAHNLFALFTADIIREKKIFTR